jgi:hypothetical protein
MAIIHNKLSIQYSVRNIFLKSLSTLMEKVSFEEENLPETFFPKWKKEVCQ